nr:3-isopropylmalate dehydratase small subunit [uncultured Oscillibacter sp.]
MIIESKVVAVMGKNVDTDVIFPTRYVASFDAKALAPHAFEDCYPGLAQKLMKGGIIVAGENFGCGSAREQAASCLWGANVHLIIAPFFSRSFYRNALNVGLPVLEIEDLPAIQADDELRVEVESGILTNITTGEIGHFAPPAKFIVDLILSGGIVNYYTRTDCYKNADLGGTDK